MNEEHDSERGQYDRELGNQVILLPPSSGLAGRI